MNVEVNLLGVFLAAVSSMVVGGIWYAKGVFGKKWMALVGMTEEKAKKGSVQALSVAFIMSLLTAYVLAHVIELSHNFYQFPYLQTGLTSAITMWSGFVFTRLVTHDLFEQRPMMLTFMNIMNELVTLLVMGVVLGLVR